MSRVIVVCPECAKELKLQDRSSLGKRGRCPKCEHVFVLQERQPAAAVQSQPSAAPSQASASSNDEASVPSKGDVEFQLAEAPVAAVAAQWVPDESPATPAQVPNATEGVRRLHELQRKKRKSRKTAALIGMASALGLAGVLYFVLPAADNETTSNRREPPKQNKALVAERETLETNTKQAKLSSPTSGEPIDLLYVPNGVQIIVNMHPAELWKSGSLGEEFRYSLVDLGVWTETKIRDICRFEPSEIEEALFCLAPGADDSMEVSVVVTLVEEQKRSDLLLKFPGERVETNGRVVHLGETYAYMFLDTKRIAICPRERADEMADNTINPAFTSDGITELMAKTDRDRHLTMVFEPLGLRVHGHALFSDVAQPFFNDVAEWLNDEEVETVAWSLHLKGGLHSELLLRNQTVVKPARLQRLVRKRIDRLPHTLLGAVEKMNPKRVGYRKLI
ncbi:MAG: hypothetical protein CMJ48_06405, partial [Planctomycetaceae bacterium]|nr:hypothetical protein [Planctomycetaceae bacterium]